MKYLKIFICLVCLITVDAQAFTTGSGEAKIKIVIKGNIGSGDGEFGRKIFEDRSWVEPSAIAIDGDGNIYIADPLNNRIQKFNSKGEYLSKIKFEVQKRYALAIDDLATDDENSLYVLSRHEQKIFKYNAAGHLMQSINLQNYMQAERVNVDMWGNIYVFGVIPAVRGVAEELRKFDKMGKLVKKWDKVYVFFIDRQGNKYLRQETSWKKYDKNDQFLGDVKCETEKLKVNFENTCHFPPVFIDDKNLSYYFVSDEKKEKIRALIKLSPNGELRTYDFSLLEIWPWRGAENMTKFDKRGNLYGYEYDDLKKQYRIIRINLE